jgi:hypothetical protein
VIGQDLHDIDKWTLSKLSPGRTNKDKGSRPLACKLVYYGLLFDVVEMISHHGLYPTLNFQARDIAPDLFNAYNYIVNDNGSWAEKFMPIRMALFKNDPIMSSVVRAQHFGPKFFDKKTGFKPSTFHIFLMMYKQFLFFCHIQHCKSDSPMRGGYYAGTTKWPKTNRMDILYLKHGRGVNPKDSFKATNLGDFAMFDTD